MPPGKMPPWLVLWSGDFVILDDELQPVNALRLETWVHQYVESGNAAREWEALVAMQHREVLAWEKEAIARFLIEGE